MDVTAQYQTQTLEMAALPRKTQNGTPHTASDTRSGVLFSDHPGIRSRRRDYPSASQDRHSIYDHDRDNGMQCRPALCIGCLQQDRQIQKPSSAGIDPGHTGAIVLCGRHHHIGRPHRQIPGRASDRPWRFRSSIDACIQGQHIGLCGRSAAFAERYDPYRRLDPDA